MKRISACVLLLVLLAGTAPARGATWGSGQEQVPGVTQTYSISQSGRAAGVDRTGRVHVAYQSVVSEGQFRVNYVVRGENGAWGEPIVISGEASARNSSLHVARDGSIHVVWEDLTNTLGDIRYRARTPEGAWGPIEALSEGGGISRDPVVTVDSLGRVHVVWVDASIGFPQILYRRRDPGPGWTPTQLLSPGGSSPESPTIAADGLGNVHIAWSDRTGDSGPGGNINHEIYHLRLEPGAATPQAPTRLTNDLAISRLPFLEATEDGTVHMVWIDNRGSVGAILFEVFYRRYLPGLGWGKDKRFSYDGQDQSRPVAIVGSENTVNVVWEDYRHGNPEIYFRQITEATGWDPKPTRLTNDLSSSVRPSLVALPDGELFLLWTDGIETGSLRVFAKGGHVDGGDGPE